MTLPVAWYRLPLSAMLPEQPTYFTGSVLGPPAERALRAGYEQFGAPLAGDAVVWDPLARRAALNDAILRPADEALRRSQEGGGGLSRLLGGGGSGRRAAALIAQTLTEAPAVIARIERWYDRVRAMEWRQATVLQIMEELEPRAEEVLLAQTRVALSLAMALHMQAGQLGARTPEFAAGLTTGIDDDLPASACTAALRRLAAGLATVEPGDAAGDWQQWPNALRQPVETFLAGYGRWADSPLETAQPRWIESPAALLAARPRLASLPDPDQAGRQRAAAVANVSGQLKSNQRKQFDAAAAQVEQLAALLPEVHGAMATVVAAARYWVSGVANEALVDGRLLSADEVFLLELEELKQMMTGEWSNVDQVRPVVEARQR